MTIKKEGVPYTLSASERYRPIYLSRGDHMGVEWYAKQRGITLTAALHEIVGGFLAPRLAAVEQDAVQQGVKEGVFTKDVLKKPRRGFPKFRKR